MTDRIDDEAEPADRVFVRWNEKATLLGSLAAPAAWRGDALDKSLLLSGRDRRDHDPVLGMKLMKSPPVLLMGFPGASTTPKIVSHASGQLSLTERSAQRRSKRVKRSGKVMATIAQAQSSSYQPTSARNSA